MRRTLLSLFLLLFSALAQTGEFSRVSLPDLLPANTMFCHSPADKGSLERDFAGTLLQRLGTLPEMGAFIRSFEDARRQLAADVSRNARVSPQLAEDLVNAKLGLALINLEIGRDGSPMAEFVVSFTLSAPPEKATVYSAVMALLNRKEVVRMVLESQGLDPNLPLKTLAQEETLSGYPPILRIGPRFRIALVGNMVLIYHGPSSEGIKKIFDALSNPSTSLARNPHFQATYRNADAAPGMSFTYFNVPRLMSVLDIMNFGQAGRVADALGFGSVQAMGLAGGFHGEGVRHSLYMHTGGQTGGLLSALAPMPRGNQIGMEGFSSIMPSSAEAFTAMRVDMQRFLRESAYFLDSLGVMNQPGGVGSFLTGKSILGVPLLEIFRTLGGDIVIRPRDDTHVMLFHNVDVPAFEHLIARMEQNAGARFNALNVGGYLVRYFNRRASIASPLAPAFCLIPRQDGSNSGILYMATHPQAVVSLIQEAAAAREPLSQTQDFKKASAGAGSNFSLYYYSGNRDCYRRVYNFLLPVAALWSSSSRYPVDTGLLPTAASILPGVFGCSIGIRNSSDGILLQAYSPVGFNALLVILADKLVVSNPIVIGYVYSFLDEWVAAMPTW